MTADFSWSLAAKTIVLVLCAAVFQSAAFAGYPSFQALVDATEENGVLKPPPGTYAGPVIVDKPMVIDGQGKVTIDNGGKGTVVLLDTNGATLKGLHLTNSGESANDIDSGVHVRGNFNVIKDNVIDDCLFGVDLQQSKNNIVRRNTISSKLNFGIGQRGDSVRLWYSFNNKITDNVTNHVRDMVVWYSADNEILRNTGSNSRYSLHFMYSRYNLVEGNVYNNNQVGIFLMYSDGVIVRNNRITHAAGPTGLGIGFKETSDLTIENNQILYCSTGFYIDVSPFQPDTTNTFTNNLVAYNGIGVRFLNEWHGNVFKKNGFAGNLTQVVVSGRGTANKNIWEDNFWSDYEGFDQDGDGIGDKPYELYAYADRLWRDEPYAQFFKGSPMLETLDFLERLAPFSKPQLLVRDKMPVVARLDQIMEAAKPGKNAEKQPEERKKSALQLLREARDKL
ncbi:MAG: nitrous oxide reductase family maturation protein NosD [Gammaproteobacteria bacterium]|nr:MAG: nitrous oxide reductase family maturation protein NosD [Gammaproteobacteria bacterium]